jgi:hypothetical protein
VKRAVKRNILAGCWRGDRRSLSRCLTTIIKNYIVTCTANLNSRRLHEKTTCCHFDRRFALTAGSGFVHSAYSSKLLLQLPPILAKKQPVLPARTMVVVK